MNLIELTNLRKEDGFTNTRYYKYDGKVTFKIIELIDKECIWAKRSYFLDYGNRNYVQLTFSNPLAECEKDNFQEAETYFLTWIKNRY